MATKKTTETFTKKTVGELVVGDRFRELSDPDRELGDIPLQEIISLNTLDSDLLDSDQVTKKQIIVCKTKIEGSKEIFLFQAFEKVGVEVLDG